MRKLLITLRSSPCFLLRTRRKGPKAENSTCHFVVLLCFFFTIKSNPKKKKTNVERSCGRIFFLYLCRFFFIMLNNFFFIFSAVFLSTKAFNFLVNDFFSTPLYRLYYEQTTLYSECYANIIIWTFSTTSRFVWPLILPFVQLRRKLK